LPHTWVCDRGTRKRVAGKFRASCLWASRVYTG